MIICAHRINTIEKLRTVPRDIGVEIDIRAFGERLVLNHEPHEGGDDLRAYLEAYDHAFIIFNIKEAGIEQEVIDLAAEFGVEDYFLLDVEYPFIYRATREGFRRIAVRYSEAEPIEFAEAHRDSVDWVWVDTNTQLPLDARTAERLRPMKLALVGPDRWGRPDDIEAYREHLKEQGIEIDLVMTELGLVDRWIDY